MVTLFTKLALVDNHTQLMSSSNSLEAMDLELEKLEELEAMEAELKDLCSQKDNINKRVDEIKVRIQVIAVGGGSSQPLPENSRRLEECAKNYTESKVFLDEVNGEPHDSAYYLQNYVRAIKDFRKCEYEYALHNPEATETEVITLYLIYRWSHMDEHWNEIREFAKIRLAPDYVHVPTQNDDSGDDCNDQLVIPDDPGIELVQIIKSRRVALK